jgi:hypothetical protein
MRIEFKSKIVSFCFSFIFVSFGESRLLVSWCAGGWCGMVCSNKDRGRSRRPGADDREWSHMSGTQWSGDREVGWHCVRSAPCTWRQEVRISWLSLKTKVDGLSVLWPQNHWDGFSSVWASKPLATVCEWFGLKTTLTVFTGLASKPVAMVCEWFGLITTRTVFAGLASKPVATAFSSLASKLVAMVSPDLTSKQVVGFLVEPQNHGGGGFPCLGLKTDNSGLVIWALKSPRQFLDLGLKTKWASVCRLHHKTDGGRSARDTHQDLWACFTWKQVWLGFPSLA